MSDTFTTLGFAAWNVVKNANEKRRLFHVVPVKTEPPPQRLKHQGNHVKAQYRQLR